MKRIIVAAFGVALLGGIVSTAYAENVGPSGVVERVGPSDRRYAQLTYTATPIPGVGVQLNFDLDCVKGNGGETAGTAFIEIIQVIPNAEPRITNRSLSCHVYGGEPEKRHGHSDPQQGQLFVQGVSLEGIALVRRNVTEPSFPGKSVFILASVRQSDSSNIARLQSDIEDEIHHQSREFLNDLRGSAVAATLGQ